MPDPGAKSILGGLYKHVETMVMKETSAEASRPATTAYYTFRIRKREVHLTAGVLAFWFLWSQGSGLIELFSRVFNSVP